MISDAQAYFLKPLEFGGGANSFEGVSLTALQYHVDEGGQHVRSFADGAAVHTLTLEQKDGVVTITAKSSNDDRVVTTVATGPKAQDISVSF